MERLINLLKANKEIAAYKITQTKTHSYQLFFVKDKLETNRLSDSQDVEVSIYVDVDKFRGRGSFNYTSYLSDEEVNEKINEAIFNAKLALNPFFEMPGPQPEPVEIKSNLKGKDFAKVAEEVAQAVFANKMDDEIYSAATEIFITCEETKISNSKGLSTSQESYFGEIELIPTRDTKEKEVEIYHMIRFTDFDFDAIKNEVAEVLKLVKDRYEAVPLPKGLNGTNIIIDGYEVGQVFGYFVQDLTYATKFQKGNLFELESSVQGDNVTGTTLNLKMVPYYPGAFGSSAIDEEGIALRDTVLVENGIAKNRFGDSAFGYYLGEKDIKGKLPVRVVEPGKTSFKEWAKKPYIRCVRFSSMQMDRLSGLVGGEVRLGYYFDGEKEIPVTGFTFVGNMHELKGIIEYSEEEASYPRYHGPKYLLLPKTSIV